MANYFIKIMYDGSCFHGWQVQPNGITVQEVIEKTLSAIAKTPISITGSGRTDSGVHAVAQYANFKFPLNMTPKQIRLALRGKLPDTIRVTEVYEVTEDLNARFTANERGYRYILTRKKSPFSRLYKSFIPYRDIDVDAMRKCVPFLLGKHDFTSFCKPNPQIKSNVCNILRLDIEERGDDIVFYINANRFLHNMVRRIVGTLVSFSHYEYEPEFINKLLEAQTSNQNIIFTAPPNGLYLILVNYPDFEKYVLDKDIEGIT